MTNTTNNNTPFGEKTTDWLDGYTLPVEWSPKYETARKAAEEAIKKYGLSENDFWIKKRLSYKRDKIVYENMIMSYAACLKVNEKLPEKKKFNPECVSQGTGADEGVLFLYRSKEQGVFVTGEASRYNIGYCPYPGASAEKRVFCRVVTRLAGLYAVGIYSEAESDDFTRPAEPTAQASSQQPIPASAPIASAPAPAAGVAPVSPSVDKMRIARLAEAIAKTQTDLDVLLSYYGVDALSQLSGEKLESCEKIIYPRLRKMEAEKQAESPSAVQPAQPDGISPIAAMLLNQTPAAPKAPAPQAETPQAAPVQPEKPIGETVYACIANAPEHFQEMNGQTFDEIGKEMLKALYGRKNSAGRRWVDAELLKKIERYLAA